MKNCPIRARRVKVVTTVARVAIVAPAVMVVVVMTAAPVVMVAVAMTVVPVVMTVVRAVMAASNAPNAHRSPMRRKVAACRTS